MKLIDCHIQNFASYRDLQFSFDNLGLSLVYGATGSGKSTLQDIPCWILYGITSKQGTVDDIRPWYDNSNTIGILQLEVKGFKLKVTRVRGRVSDNDLYWTENEEDKEYRGKDITETQKLLEQRLGVSSDLYITAAYSSEFSPTSTFFVDKPKTKRELFEKIADLSLPIKLEEKIKDERKELKKQVKEKEEAKARQDGRLEALVSSLRRSSLNEIRWNSDREKRLRDLQSKYKNFETLKHQELDNIKHLMQSWENNKELELKAIQKEISEINSTLSNNSNTVCPACGSEQKHIQKQIIRKVQLENKLEFLYESTNPHTLKYKQKSDEINTFGSELIKVESEKNPHTEEAESLNEQIQSEENKKSVLMSELEGKLEKLNQLDTLEKLSLDLRGLLLQKATNNVQNLTNEYLEKHFDSEIKVKFELSKADLFNIEITKNSYICNFKQLSTGQRRLLTLCFTVAVMQYAANEAGVHFNLLSFDECLNGLDSELKLKAFDLFVELSTKYDSILLIEHASEFQNLFDNKYKVIISDDISEIRAG